MHKLECNDVVEERSRPHVPESHVECREGRSSETSSYLLTRLAPTVAWKSPSIGEFEPPCVRARETRSGGVLARRIPLCERGDVRFHVYRPDWNPADCDCRNRCRTVPGSASILRIRTCELCCGPRAERSVDDHDPINHITRYEIRFGREESCAVAGTPALREIIPSDRPQNRLSRWMGNSRT